MRRLRTDFAPLTVSLRRTLRCYWCWLAAILSPAVVCFSANAAVEVLGVQYQQDKLHPEFDCIWKNIDYPTSCPSNFAGANVHVYLRNNGATSINVTNVTLAGYELKTIIKERVQGQNDPYSIYYYWDDPPQAIFDAGEPVWYRYDPTNIPPGGVFQVIVRLRLVPVTQPVSVGVMTDVGTVTTNIAVDADTPYIASVGFSPDLRKVYLHWRRSGGGGAVPTSVWMNGTDVSSLTTTVCDTNFNFGVSVITRTDPLGYMGYNVFQGVYADGKTATAGLRAWLNRFNYGTYGAAPTTTKNDGKAWINSCEARGVNLLIMNNGSDGLTDLLNTDDGQTYAAEHDYDFLVDVPSKWNVQDPMGWYLRDEPDAHDNHITREDNDTPPNLYLPENDQHSVGVLAMHEVFNGDDLHYRQGEITPTVVNVDATYMPYNYYTYGQLADIGMTDPYYTSRQSGAYWNNPKNIPLYEKATYIYAVAQAMTEASEPNPSLVAMNSTGDLSDPGDGSQWWPYSTPECIRMEAYYALAAGAKSMGYWWMLGSNGFGEGIVAGEPACTALWKGIGLCGNEFKTAQPLIVISHPVELTVTPSANVWARALLAGVDSLLLVVANDRYTNDINGFHYSPITNATVTVTLPSWFNSSVTSFEIAEQAEGVKDVNSALTGNELQVDLGTLNVTRLIVVTTNAQLRATIQQRYLGKSYQGVCAFAPEHCTEQYTCILNADAEGGFRLRGGGYIANDWYEFEGADGTNIVCYDETSIKHGGSHSQRIRVWKNGISSPGASGGVYQRIPAFPGTNYTISVWTYAADTSSYCYLGVDPTGGVNQNSGSVSWSTANSSVAWIQKTATVTASTNFITVFYKVASTDGGKRNGYFDDATPACSSPTITQNPTGATNCPGANVNFSVAASGSGTFSYQWQRDGINLTDAGHYSGATTSTLTVTGADASDAGDYQCAVTTSYGVIFSSAATLTLKSLTGITQEPSATNVCPGANVTFTVGASGEGVVTYQWQTNGVSLSDGDHYAGVTTATLTITNVGSGDAVNYRCVVTGDCGSTTSSAPALSLKAVTAITQDPSSVQVLSGSNATFTVAAAGQGTLFYQWRKNDVNLSDGGHYSGATTTTLTVTGADPGDVADYDCVVTGGCGAATSASAALQLVDVTTFNYLVNRGIPDGGLTGVFDTRSVASSIQSLTGVKVRLKVSGTFNGDLYCYVTHGSGFSVVLNRVGRTANSPFGYDDPGVEVTFDDGGGSDVHVYRLVVTGDHNIGLGTNVSGVWGVDGRTNRPNQVLDTDGRVAKLENFTGLDPNGAWTIFVADVAGGDVHVLESWGLELEGTAAPATGTIYGQVQLEGFTGEGPRAVQFVASNSGGVPLQTNDVSLTFAGSPKVADYSFSVPTNTVYLSAKTGWNLRRRQAVVWSDGMATNDFTGSGGELLGGDISQNNNLVNTADYTVLKENWLKNTNSADINGDGLVNTADYTILKGNWLKAGDSP